MYGVITLVVNVCISVFRIYERKIGKRKRANVHDIYTQPRTFNYTLL
jgi:hypothetical protein